MADENDINEKIRELLEAHQRGSRSFADVINEVISLMRAGGKVSSAELQRLAQAAGAASSQTKGLEQAAKGARDSLNGLGTLGSTLTNGQARLSTFNSLISSAADVISGFAKALGPLGSLFGGAVQAASAGLQFVNKEFEKTYDAFTQLSRVGAAGAGGMDDTIEQFKALGVPINMLSTIVSKNADRLAGLEGSVADAALEFAKAAGAAKNAAVNTQLSDMQLRILGYTTEEISDTFTQYADLQRRFGVQQTLTQDQLIQGSIRYGRELDVLAKLTGQSRDQLKRQLDQKMLDERFAATLRGMSEVDQRRMQAAALAVENIFGPQLSKAVMAGVTDMYTTQEAKDAAVAVPGFMKMVSDLKRGTIDLPTFLQQLQDGTKVAEQQFRGLAQATGNATGVTRQYNEYIKGSTADAGKLAEGYQKAVDQVNKASDSIVPPGPELEGTTQATANAMKSFEQAGANISALATQAKFATNMVSGMAEAVKDITGWINNFIETGSLGRLETQQQVKTAIDQRAGMYDELKKISKQLETETDPEKVAALNARLGELNQSIQALTGQLGQTYGMRSDTGVKGTRTVGLEPIMPGTPLYDKVSSGEMPVPEGMYLFQPTPKTEATTTAPTTPTTPTTPNSSIIPETPQEGSRGAVMTGPTSGYRATLHGTEAVVPLDGNRSIPVEIKDSRDSGTSIKMMEAQLARLGEMVEAIKENTRINEKISRNISS